MLSRVSAKVIHLGEDAHRRGNPGADGWSSSLFSLKGLNNKHFISERLYLLYLYILVLYLLKLV